MTKIDTLAQLRRITNRQVASDQPLIPLTVELPVGVVTPEPTMPLTVELPVGAVEPASNVVDSPSAESPGSPPITIPPVEDQSIVTTAAEEIPLISPKNKPGTEELIAAEINAPLIEDNNSSAAKETSLESSANPQVDPLAVGTPDSTNYDLQPTVVVEPEKSVAQLDVVAEQAATAVVAPVDTGGFAPDPDQWQTWLPEADTKEEVETTFSELDLDQLPNLESLPFSSDTGLPVAASKSDRAIGEKLQEIQQLDQQVKSRQDQLITLSSGKLEYQTPGGDLVALQFNPSALINPNNMLLNALKQVKEAEDKQEETTTKSRWPLFATLGGGLALLLILILVASNLLKSNSGGSTLISPTMVAQLTAYANLQATITVISGTSPITSTELTPTSVGGKVVTNLPAPIDHAQYHAPAHISFISSNADATAIFNIVNPDLGYNTDQSRTIITWFNSQNNSSFAYVPGTAFPREPDNMVLLANWNMPYTSQTTSQRQINTITMGDFIKQLNVNQIIKIDTIDEPGKAYYYSLRPTGGDRMPQRRTTCQSAVDVMGHTDPQERLTLVIGDPYDCNKYLWVMADPIPDNQLSTMLPANLVPPTALPKR